MLKGYAVHGLVRRSSSPNTSRIDYLQSQHRKFSGDLILHHGDVHDLTSLSKLLREIEPDEIYNLAAQSHVRYSFDTPIMTANITGSSTLGLLEIVRQVTPGSRFYQASSSEMFGATPPPQDEESTFYPRSPYAVSKVFAYWASKNYREAYNLFVSNGILFNHESPRRGETFVTRKISRAAARIKLGHQSSLKLGNLDATRDWGYAPEYIVAMWLMLQADNPDDYTIATGTGSTVREFLSYSFGHLNLDWEKYVEFDERYVRPTEVDSLIGNSAKAESQLGWNAQVHSRELAEIMTAYDLKDLGQGSHSESGYLHKWAGWLD